MEVRIAAVPSHLRHMQKYVDRTGKVIGFTGQFVLVHFEGENMAHCFLPIELKTEMQGG